MTRLRLISPADPHAPAGALPTSPVPARPGAEPGLEPGAPVDIDDLFQLYAADVAARGLSMLGNPDEADDLVQDVFLRAFRAARATTSRFGPKRLA